MARKYLSEQAVTVVPLLLAAHRVVLLQSRRRLGARVSSARYDIDPGQWCRSAPCFCLGPAKAFVGRENLQTPWPDHVGDVHQRFAGCAAMGDCDVQPAGNRAARHVAFLLVK